MPSAYICIAYVQTPTIVSYHDYIKCINAKQYREIWHNTDQLQERAPDARFVVTSSGGLWNKDNFLYGMPDPTFVSL